MYSLQNVDCRNIHACLLGNFLNQNEKIIAISFCLLSVFTIDVYRGGR